MYVYVVNMIIATRWGSFRGLEARYEVETTVINADQVNDQK